MFDSIMKELDHASIAISIFGIALKAFIAILVVAIGTTLLRIIF